MMQSEYAEVANEGGKERDLLFCEASLVSCTVNVDLTSCGYIQSRESIHGLTIVPQGPAPQPINKWPWHY
jgi:glutathionyl-hydroquinone reductase